MNIRLALVVAVATVPLCAWSEEPLRYSLTDIGTLGGTRTYGYGINSDGEVTGYSTIGADINEYHAFLYHHGMMEDLGTPGRHPERGCQTESKTDPGWAENGIEI